MSSQWFLYKNQQQQGPFSWEKLVEQARAHIIGPADMIWTEGMGGWSRADQVEGLITPAPKAAVPPPANPQFAGPALSASSPAGAKSETAGAAGKSSTGMEANIAGLLCYIFGWITGIIFLFIEKESKFVKFHAMQSIVTFGGLTALQILVGILSSLIWSILLRGAGAWALAGTITTLLGILSTIIWLTTLALAILLMVKAYQHETFKLPIAGKIAEKQLQ